MEQAVARGRPVTAGIVTALVGFTSSFAVVLAGLRAVGATRAQAASGVVAICLVMALGMLWLSLRHRQPVSLAWSTPGAALLASTGAVDGGWPAAVGAFLVVGGMIVLTGLWGRLGKLVAAIPAPIAQAVLAGVVLELCLAPARGAIDHPWSVGAILVVWLLLMRWAPRWAVPGAFAALLVIVVVDVARDGGVSGGLLPRLVLTSPTLTWSALIGIAVPLYVVTMAGQNVPGAAVLASYGYTVPWRESMAVTGVGTLLGATAGGFTLNLAAITAALSASPEADPDPARRWRASSSAAGCYVVLALLSTALIALLTSAPPLVVGAVAGVALLPTLGSSLSAAAGEPTERIPAIAAFAVAASGADVHGVGSAFLALVVGLVVRAALRAGRRSG